MDIFRLIAEERIKEAIADGAFDNLPGKGKPLVMEDLSHVPEDMRMSYKVMKNAGFLPPEMQLSKEMVTLQDMLALCTTEEERVSLRDELTEKKLRYRMMLEAKGLYGNSAFTQYEQKVRAKLEGDE
ncbi:hypothetical protein FHS18_001533 [Paenibacillus phyllosphaerae]|uniref:DnaJ homologue subfamily C member 28 conserved domain-containing protein n=1 Tax=Paenibacillus phyllosphaerae TaxID=274593 RepID=A0A7W5FLT0_9BACL|nr:DUF1992 domain-containing protein [Paenibacillus phyllosphaerae]MBB3109481.1 hypothetical protein [Paenibacillus phyllosphaerae]